MLLDTTSQVNTAHKISPFAKTVTTASFQISPQKITRVLSFVVSLIIAAGISAQYLRFSLTEAYMREKHYWWLMDKFDLDGEFNVPNFYQTLSLLFCGILLMMIARASKNSNKNYVLHWWGLAATFIFLGCDEAIQLHEMTILPLRNIFGTDGYFFYAWVMLAAILVPIFGLLYIKFLWALPVKFRWLFITAGTVYVAGALGLEMVGGQLRKIYGLESVQYVAETILEESLEMIGILIFIYALLSYFSHHVKEFQFQFTEQKSQ